MLYKRAGSRLRNISNPLTDNRASFTWVEKCTASPPSPTRHSPQRKYLFPSTYSIGFRDVSINTGNLIRAGSELPTSVTVKKRQKQNLKLHPPPLRYLNQGPALSSTGRTKGAGPSARRPRDRQAPRAAKSRDLPSYQLMPPAPDWLAAPAARSVVWLRPSLPGPLAEGRWAHFSPRQPAKSAAVELGR